jgi:hypothetical protein
MGFSVFQYGTRPSVETILADPVIRQVLYSLHTEHLFLSLGQIQHYLRVLAPSGTPDRLLSREKVIAVFDQLVDADYLGREHALLPDITITKGIFGKSFAAPTPEDLTTLVEAGRSRVPSLDSHRNRNLYYSTDSLSEVLRSFGYTVVDWSASENRQFQLGSRPRQFEWVLAEHRELEQFAEHSQYDIACTLLTAQYNLNEIRFMDRYRAEIASGARTLVAHKPPTPAFLDGMFIGPDYESTALYFLRPLPPYQLRAQIDEYSAHAFDIAMKQNRLVRCVWM